MDAIYARQSIDKKGSLSIEGQIELCRKFTVDDALVFSDKGFSGKNTKRPAFGELMEAVEAGRVKKIVVYRLDRFSRSLADFSQIWELLRKNNVEFLSVNEQFDTSSPMGRAMLNIVMTFAQLERETTAERGRLRPVQAIGFHFSLCRALARLFPTKEKFFKKIHHVSPSSPAHFRVNDC